MFVDGAVVEVRLTQGSSGAAVDVSIDKAISLYAENNFSASFYTVLKVLEQGFDDFNAQELALRILNRIRGEGLAIGVKEWINACRFGNMANAAIIVPGISDDPVEIYALCARLASIAFKMGHSDLSLKIFNHCVTEQMPPPVLLQETESAYRDVAVSYDDDPLHQDAVTDFMAALRRHLGAGGPYDIIDAPCGTGLAGPALAPLARRMVGCDLSADMLEKAKRHGCYDSLIVGDLTETLPQLAGDLMVCLGSLYHFKELAPVATAAAAALRSGGWFAFTDFPAPRGLMTTVSGSQRYCRGDDCVRDTLAAQGFEYAASELLLLYKLPCKFWLFRKA